MSPDPAFLFRSSQHEEALANLIYGVQSRKGFVLLSGEVGTGKTTMLECLRDFLHAQQIAFASLFNSRLTVGAVLRTSGLRPGIASATGIRKLRCCCRSTACCWNAPRRAALPS
ncbi:MAG: AAA family ATPase [Ignavibacteriota bacterium]